MKRNKYVYFLIIRIYWSLTKENLFLFAATAPICALAYLHETLRFTSVF
jgi:hypothetical protein